MSLLSKATHRTGTSTAAKFMKTTAPRAMSMRAGSPLDALDNDGVAENFRHRHANWHNEPPMPMASPQSTRTDYISPDVANAARLHNFGAMAAVHWADESYNIQRMSSRALSSRSGASTKDERPKPKTPFTASFLKQISNKPREQETSTTTKKSPTGDNSKRTFATTTTSSNSARTQGNKRDQSSPVSGAFLRKLAKPAKRGKRLSKGCIRKNQPCWSVDGELYIP
mgnify:CR=1 FL=1